MQAKQSKKGSTAPVQMKLLDLDKLKEIKDDDEFAEEQDILVP